MTLQSWLRNKWLKEETTSLNEIETLLRKAARDVEEAQKEEIDLDWRLAIAYNASLGFAGIALRAKGFRTPHGDGHHFRTIESLKYTIEPGQDLVMTLQAIRKKRGIVSYDAAGQVSLAEVCEAIAIAIELQKLVIEWLQTNHPELLSGQS